MAAQLLGVDSVRLRRIRRFIKNLVAGRPPRIRTKPAYRHAINQRLDSIRRYQYHNGAMAYVPGSTKRRTVDITHRSQPYDILSDPKLGY